MVTYVSKENNLGPDDKIRYIWGLKGPIFILHSAAGPHLLPISIPTVIYEIKLLLGLSHFKNQGQLFQINYINTNCFLWHWNRPCKT